MPNDPSRLAAVAAAIEEVEPGMTLGLGSGRAVFALADALVERYGSKTTFRAAVASAVTAEHVGHSGIEVIDLTADVRIDLAIDGADEVDPDLGLIKGGGAALLHEKLIIAAADRVIIMAEASKKVARLGDVRRLPVEVVKYGWEVTSQRILQLTDTADLRTDNGRPVVTEENDLLLDVTIPPGDLHEFAARLKATLGVVEHGLFLDQADEVIFGSPDGTTEHVKRQLPPRHSESQR